MRILGIELGSWSLKAVEAESRFRRFDILDFHEIRLPLQILDPVATYRQAVEQLMARLPSHPEKIVTSLPSSQTALRFLQLPIKQKKKVEQTYRFELEDSIPFKLDDSLLEHHVERVKDGSLVFAAIAPKKHIQSHIEWLKSIGLDPDWLTFEGMGLANLFLAAQQSVKKEPKAQTDEEDAPEPDDSDSSPTLLLDIGHQKTNLAVFDENQLQLFRTIAWGGAAVSQSIALNMGLPLEEAERCKMNDLKLDIDPDNCPPEMREMLNAGLQAFSAFLADINHSLVAFRTTYGKRVGNVLITGGSSKIWGIDNYLTRTLDAPTEIFKSFQTVEIDDSLEKADESRFGEPLGRALVYERNASLLFNFRKGDLGKETSITEVSEFLKNPNILKLLRYTAVFAAILFIHVNVASYLSETEIKASTEELRRTFSDTFPAVNSKLRQSLTSNPNELQKFIKQKNTELDQKLKMLQKERLPMLSLLRGISEAFPPDVRVDVNKLQMDDRSFTVDGVVYQGELAKVTAGLQAVATLKNVTLDQQGQRFTFKGEVVGRR